MGATAVAANPATSAPAAPLAAAAPSQGGPLDGALGIVALVGAGGIALLRMRQLSGAMGLTDAGTLTALGHSAATFWAGSCYSLVGPASASTSAPMAASPFAATVVPGGAAGGRAQFGVAGVISRGAGLSGVAPSSGVELPPVEAPPLPTGTSERTGLVALLLAVSAALGAALGGISLRRRGAPEADAG